MTSAELERLIVETAESMRRWHECPWEEPEAVESMRFWFNCNRGRFFKLRRARRDMIRRGWPEDLVKSL